MRTLGAFGCLLMLASLVVAGAPATPDTPVSADDVLYARPFKLTEAYTFAWQAEKPEVTEGYVLVLKVDKDLVYPRQTAEPVLYVGETTAERVNVGYESGHLIVIVPADLEKFELDKARIWFGAPALPEQVDKTQITNEAARATTAGVAPRGEEEITRATEAGGDTLEVADYTTLRRSLVDLVQKYAPDEDDLVRQLTVPLVGSK
jgi:hypothetical protein